MSLEAALPQIRQVLADNRTLVLTAETGAGKSTLLPPALLGEPWLRGRRLLLLEPRRVAARAVALRMASLRGEAAGQTVGWRTAEDSRIGPNTRLEVVTEGILIRRLQNDPELGGVGAVLFDEFHERGMLADLGLALSVDVRRALRPDLRLVVLSATLDTAPVLALLGDGVALHVPGRAFPVTTSYRPAPVPGDALEHVARSVEDGWDAVRGGLLVFLPGWGEIRRCQARLEAAARSRGEHLVTLHGSLGPEEQAQALVPGPGGRRRTVLASAVAETSLTIPDIELVIDAGWARLNRFDQARGLDRLVTERVSQASADQRRGRAGRTGPGLCWRLWPATERLEPALEPEILRADLAETVLDAAVWGVRRPDQVAWVTPPPESAWQRAREHLGFLGVLGEAGDLSPAGRQVAAWGLGPRWGTMLLRAPEADRPLAAACVALLRDRDPLADQSDPDLTLRLEPLLGGDPGPVWARLRTAAREVARRVGVEGGGAAAPGWPQRLGALLAPAWGDRLARRGEGSPTQAVFHLVGGRQVAVRGPLAASPWLVVLDADAGASAGRVTLAVAVAEGVAEAALAPQTRTLVEVDWDGWRPRVFRRRRVGALVLERTGLNPADHGEAVTSALRERLEHLDPETLPWSRSSTQLVHRLALLGRRGPSSWLWLEPWCDLGGGPCLTEARLRRALEEGLPWDLRQRLDHEVPETLTVPSGSVRRLRYEADGTVILEVRLQEIFGWTASPVVGGRPVQLHLLSPAQRPVQITSDLAQFWRATYPEVRKELRGRYPRHAWPEDPLTAPPTARAKPRGT